MNKIIKLKGELYDLSRPKVMGILNVTPDSFFDGGNYLHEQSLIDQICKMIDEGADMIDVGAFSSRPGAKLPSLEEEQARIEPALNRIRKEFPDVVISVDTYRSQLAKMVVEKYGIDMINDISGGMMDEKMIPTIAELQVPYIMMHMKGTPDQMQTNPHYENMVKEISLFFSSQLDKCRQVGVSDVIIDPGFGFGKSLNHNYELLEALPQLDLLKCPMLVGVSRKSMIQKVIGTSPEESLNGTTVINTIALLHGASILRVHDVKEAVEAVALVNQYTNSNLPA